MKKKSFSEQDANAKIYKHIACFKLKKLVTIETTECQETECSFIGCNLFHVVSGFIGHTLIVAWTNEALSQMNK